MPKPIVYAVTVNRLGEISLLSDNPYRASVCHDTGKSIPKALVPQLSKLLLGLDVDIALDFVRDYAL